MNQTCVYILTNRPRGTLYVGVTSDPVRRFDEHRRGAFDGFAKRYHLRRIVRIELFEDMHEAIEREKQLKRWHRQWKINLVESENADWRDLATEVGFAPLDAETSSA